MEKQYKINNMNQYPNSTSSQIDLSINQQTFSVYELTGEEALSQLFQFNITLILPLTIDFDYTINTSAQLSISNENNYKRDICGIITKIRHAGLFDTKQIQICIQLQPLLTRLILAKSLQYFQNQTVIDVIQQILIKIGYRTDQIKLMCLHKYPVQSDIVQTPNETDYHFVQRLMAQYGIFYWLMTEKQQEVIYICDNNQNYLALITDNLLYLPQTALALINPDDLNYGYFYQMQTQLALVPNSFSVRHFNPDINKEPMEVNDHLNSNYNLTVQLDSHLSDNLEELEWEAMLRSRRVKIDSYNLVVKGNANLLSPGSVIVLNAQYFHNNDTFNNNYLIIKLNHHATQPCDKYGSGLSLSYHNEATLIPKNTLYCDHFPEASHTPACWIGHIHSNDIYPKLDNDGNYNVKSHYNINKSSNAQSSVTTHRLTHFGGIGNHNAIGKHLPLNNNTEVLLSCFKNNFNKPFIVGALPNYIFKSPVIAANNSQNIVVTQQDNLLLFEDRLNEQKIQLATKDMQNILELDASTNRNIINIISQQGQLNLYSNHDLTLCCDNSLIEKCGYNWVLSAEQNCFIKSNNGSISYQSDNNLLLNAKQSILINAKNNLAINSKNNFILKSQKASIQCNSSTYNATQGNIFINCAKSISLISMGTNKIQFINQASRCKIAADGTISICGNLIQLTGAEIYLNGTISK